MNSRALFLLVVMAPLALGGCSGLTRQQQRALSGGAIGAAGGAALTAAAGGGVLAGALIGGAAGSALGGLTRIGE